MINLRYFEIQKYRRYFPVKMTVYTKSKSFSELAFMALTVWRESRGECREAQIAVAHSILNRVQHPKWWGDDVLSVVTRKWQYSSLTDPHDKQLTTWPEEDNPSWDLALEIAYGVLSGNIANPAPGADSYHDISIRPPDWTKSARFVRQIGRMRFYDVDHDYEATVLDGKKNG
jgi:spore germination cell wall hydrolase CwlJ-like protein